MVTPIIPRGLVGSGVVPKACKAKTLILSFAFANLILGSPNALKSVRSSSCISTGLFPTTDTKVLRTTSSALIKPAACAPANPPLYAGAKVALS